MNNKESINESINEQYSLDNPVGNALFEYGEEFEMGAELKFEETCRECEKKLHDLDDECKKVGKTSSFERTFSGFVKTCKEKSSECVETATDRAIELARANDLEVAILSSNWRAGISGGRWASKGEMGTGEYIFEVLGSKCNPQNIGRLETMSKTIPSSEFARFENMRMDAYRIENIVIAGRSFIHDCAPEAYKLIDAMIAYYDSKDDPSLVEKKRDELDSLLSELREKHGSGYTDPHEKLMFDLENYDKPASNYQGDGPGGVSSKRGNDRIVDEKTGETTLIYDGEIENEVKAIDILRRLKRNMAPVSMKVSKTKIPQLDEAFEQLGIIPINEQTGKAMVSINDLTDVLTIINAYLTKNQGKRVLFPSTISAITYVDKLAAEALQGISKKEWQEMMFDPTFKETIRFAQLTMGDDYSETKFEQFYDKFKSKASKAYRDDGIDSNTVAEAYKMISELASKNAATIASGFSNNKRLNYLAKAVWSGNLTHELIGLFNQYT